MKNAQKLYNSVTKKLSLNTLSFCLLLMVSPAHSNDASAIANTVNMDTGTKALNPKNNNEENKTNGIPDDVKSAVEKALVSKIEIIKVEMDEELQVFKEQIYKVRPVLGYVSVVDGEVLELNKPSTSAVLSDYLKFIRDDFVLDSEEQANILANAFNKTITYEIDEIIKPTQNENVWILPRRKFFKKYSSLVFTTDEKGKIILIEYILGLDPKSYKPLK